MIDFINKSSKPTSLGISSPLITLQKPPARKRKLTKENKQFLKLIKLSK